MPPPFAEQDPLDLEIDRFLSNLPPIGASRAQPATDPLDIEIDSFLSSLPSPAVAPPRPDPSKGFTEQTIDFAKGIASGVSSVFGGLAGASEAAGNLPQLVPGQQAASRILQPITGAVRQADARVQEAMRPSDELLGDVRQRPELLTNPRWWASGGGQVVGSAAPYLASGGLGAAATFAPGVIEALTEGGAAYNEAITAGRSPEEASIAAAQVAGANAALVAATNKLGYGVARAIKPAIVRRGAQVVTEAGQEAGQEVISNVAAGRPAGEGVANALVLGGIGGAAIGDTHDAARPPIPSVRVAPQERTPDAAPFRLPVAQRAPEGVVAAPAVDPVDQQIDAFLAGLPPSENRQKPEVDTPSVKQSGQFDELRNSEPPARGTLEAAIVDQFGGQVTDDQVAQLAGQARTEDVSSDPHVRDMRRRREGQSFETFAGADAVAQGYRGTEEEAAAEVVRRARELHDAEQGSGAVERTPKALLEAIRDVGGIHVDDADLGGELRRLKEFKDPRTVNQIAGVQGVFRRGGLTLDDMAGILSREMGWEDITDPGDLVDAIEAAAVAGREGRASTPKFDIEHYATGAGVKPGTKWWTEKEVPRNPKLTGAHADVQERAARSLENDWAGFRQRYDEQFGNELNADNASELFDDYAASKESRSTLVRAVRAPAAALIEDLYQRKLAEEAGPDAVVIFTGGGNGSGKSSALAEREKAAADIVFDSTMSEFEPTRQKIDAALDSGRFVELRYVYRDPVAAFERGVLPRAVKSGRTVPIPTHVNSHIGSLRTVRQLAEHYATEPGVNLEVFEAKEGPAVKSRFTLEPTTLDALAAKEYPDPNGLRQQLQAVLERADVPAAIREGTNLSPRAPGAGDTERAAGFSTLRGGVGSGAGSRAVDVGNRDAGASPSSRGGLPPVLGESYGERTSREARGYVRFPVRTAASANTRDASRAPAVLADSSRSATSTERRSVGRLPVKLRPDLDEGIGSPTRRVFESEPDQAVAGKAPKKPLSESQAVAQLQQIFGHERPPTALERIGLRSPQRTPLTTKAGRFREKAFGVYKIEPQVIRLKRFGDLATFTHELGHHIDFGVFEEGGRPGDKLFADELMRLGANTSPGGASKKYRMAEGVAEFFRLYFPTPDHARQAAPQFYAAFEEVLAANPSMAKQFAQGQEVVQAYLAQDLATRGAARVDFSRREVDEDARTLTQRLEVQWIDDLADLRRAVETLSDDAPIPYRQNAYVLARLARGAAGKASGFLQFGPRRDDGTFLGGSFADAIAPVRGRLQEFSQYLVASRVPELRGRGIETGMTLREAEAITTKHGSPEFARARAALYAYQNAVIEYAVQGGALSPAIAEKMRLLNQHYVPFHRLMSDDVRPGVARRIADRTLPIKRIKGSGRDIIDPLESIIKNTHAIVDMVEKNKAMRALVRHATKTRGGGQFIEAIPQPKQATRFNLDALRGTIRDVLRDANLAVKSVRDEKGDYIEVEGQAVNLEEMVTVFTPATFSMPGQDLISIIDGGKRVFYAVNDKALYQAITQIGAQPSMVLGALLAKPASMLRAGATLTLGFIGRNPIRDTFVAAVQSRHGFKPGVDTLRGLFEYLRHGEQYQLFLNSGAAGAALVSGDRKLLQTELRKYASAGTLADHLRDVVAHPIDALRALSEATEVATRLGEFMRVTGKGKGKKTEMLARAGLAARDVTLDFSRAGTRSREWNAYVAFFNAQIQGYDRMVQTFRTDPIGATIRATAAITLMSIATWVLNHDDEEWRELPEWEKSTYWHIPLKDFGGTGWMRIPKPFELGATFGTTFEKALDHISGEDPNAWKRLMMDDPGADPSKVPLHVAKSAWWAAVNVLVPTAVLPMVEVLSNYSTFRGRNIVSPFDVNLEPELQFNRWTSETAKAIGTAIEYPPAKIDHLIYGYGAGLARGVVGGVEGAAKRVLSNNAAPASGASKLPGVGAFVRDVAGSDAESLAEFYRWRDALEGAAGSAKRYKLQGDVDEQGRIKAKFPTLDGDRKKFRRAAEDLKDLRDQVDGVFKDTKLDSDAKREKLDRIYEQMVNRARQALGKDPLPSRFSGKVPVPMARR